MGNSAKYDAKVFSEVSITFSIIFTQHI